jgi:CBS domain containing-hemolysin-like protein
VYPLISFLGAPVPPSNNVEGTIGGLVFYITLALGISFLCSILEAALLSSTQSHIELLVQQGKKAGRLLQQQKLNVERPISAILTLNTIAHTVGAAGAGAEAAAIFGSQFLGVISAVLTLLILVFSEIIPKTLGAVYWKPLSTFTAYAVQFLVLALLPAVWAFEQMTRLMRPKEVENTVTRADLEVLARIGAQEGTLDENENRVLRNLFRLDKVKIETIMTPRTVIMALSQNLTIREVMAENQTMPYSRIPVYDGDLDNVTGYVLRYQVLHHSAMDDHDLKLEELRNQMHIVPENRSVGDVFEDFIEKKEHIFLVIDEYGGTAGIITLEDAIEALLGLEITDESDVVEDLRKLATERFERQRKERSQLIPKAKFNPNQQIS